MKRTSIKKLVENETLGNLRKAETAIVEEKVPPIEVEGENEGEKLTHVLAASWILEKIKKGKMNFQEAFRAYAKRVRSAIG